MQWGDELSEEEQSSSRKFPGVYPRPQLRARVDNRFNTQVLNVLNVGVNVCIPGTFTGVGRYYPLPGQQGHELRRAPAKPLNDEPMNLLPSHHCQFCNLPFPEKAGHRN